MNKTFIILVILIVVVVIFSVQNALPVAVSFLFWKFEASLAIIVFLSFLSGAVLGLLFRSLFGMGSSNGKVKAGQA